MSPLWWPVWRAPYKRSIGNRVGVRVARVVYSAFVRGSSKIRAPVKQRLAKQPSERAAMPVVM